MSLEATLVERNSFWWIHFHPRGSKFINIKYIGIHIHFHVDLYFHAIDIEFLRNYTVTKYHISYKNVLYRKEMKSLALNFN